MLDRCRTRTDGRYDRTRRRLAVAGGVAPQGEKMLAEQQAPYLSVVATARNDNHGGDLLHRMQLFVDNVIGQCNRHGIPAELILVEWNPPTDQPRLADALRWPEDPGLCTVRIIDVPNAAHGRLRHSDRLPLFQMIAKNVGIRRAHGDFVLVTNIDILFSHELMAYIAERRLERGLMYRVDRYDVEADIDVDVTLDEQLATAESTVIRVCRRDGTLDIRDGTFYRIYDSLYYLPWWLGVPLRLVRDLWRPALTVPVRYPYRLARFIVRAPRRLAAAALHPGLKQGDSFGLRLLARLTHPVLRPVRLALVALLLSGAIAAEIWREARRRLREVWRLFIFERARVKLHTNASGDFELLARDDWGRTNGYAELEMYSMHLDSLHMFMAHWTGLRERFLPFKVYHLEHEGGFKPDPVGSQRLNARLNRDEIQQISNEQLFDWIIEMAQSRQSLTFNDENWGFARETFLERRIEGRIGATVLN
jgi:hypothetical protein